MFRRYISLLILIPFVFLSSGCSTLVHGNRELVSFRTTPAGANVKIGMLRGTTPYTADLATDKDYVANISLEGYKDEQIQIVKSFRAGTTILGNIFWLLIGVVVDFVSGSAYGLDPNEVDLELEKK